MEAPLYDSNLYDQNRPRYPQALFDKVYEFHRLNSHATFELAVDLGCGTGITTKVLANSFQKVIAVDPSQEMLNQINHPNIETLQTDAEKFVLKEQVDLITISTAAHWMEMELVYQNAFQSLKQTGTLAIWAYGHCVFPDYPELTRMFLEYSMDFLASYWDPRRERLDRLYSDPEYTMSPFPVYNRQMYPDDENPPLMKMQWSWEQLSNYLKTWSPYKLYKEKNPNQPDCVDIFIAEGKSMATNVATLNITFPIVLILCKKEIGLGKTWKCTLTSTTAPSE
jgi:trans-aconitate 3-methyltransferase